MPPAYFDYNATTRLDPIVREAMLPYLDQVFGNPSSVHSLGRRARSTLDGCRERVAAVLRCKPGELIFTSGGSEANNLAILGAARALKHRGRHIIVSSIEHPSVFKPCQYLAETEGYDVTFLPTDRSGMIEPDHVAKHLRSDTILVSVMAANNETGIINPVAEIGSLCKSRGILFHVDAVQWFGKMPFHSLDQFAAGLVSLCSHKFHGPKGAGLLYSRSPFFPEPLILGGSQESEHRAGTENLAAIVGLTAAIEGFLTNPVFPPGLREFCALLESQLTTIPGVQPLGTLDTRLPNTVAFTVAGSNSISLVAALDLIGFAVSSGSACSAGSLEPSRVLLGMGTEPSLANSFVRVSLGRDSTLEEVQRFCSAFPGIISRCRN